MRLEIHTEMIDIEAQYFSYSRIFLTAIGLWPYRQSMLAQIQCVFVFGILSSALTFHMSPFILTEFTSALVIDALPSALVIIVYAIQYNAFFMNVETVRFILEQLQQTCDELRDKNELAIIEKYSNMTRRYIVTFTTGMVTSGIIYLLIQSWPNILDIVLPRNESRPRFLLFPVEYLLHHYRYFYLVRLNTNVSVCIGNLIIIGVSTLIFASHQYICGLFLVASYRIEQAMRLDILRNIGTSNKNRTFEGIIGAVDIHCKAMKYSEILVSRFGIMFILLIIVGILSLSLNLFRVFQIMSSGFNAKDMTLPVTLTIIIIFYMFVINYMGQSVTNHNNQIFITAYNVQWYEAPVPVQKLILFLLQRGFKDFYIKIASGLVLASLQCFAALVNTSMSYFTVLYSTQR